MEITEQALKIYVKNSINKQGCLSIVWDLPNGDEIYFQKGFKKPHLVSPEPFKGAKYGDYGYEGCISWTDAWKALTDANLIGSDEEECYGY